MFALLIVALALGSGLVARLLSIRPFQILGDASYAMYILQEPVLIWTMKLPLIGALPKQMFVPFYVLTLIAASIACQRFIAEPARIWLLGARNRGGVRGPGPSPLPTPAGVQRYITAHVSLETPPDVRLKTSRRLTLIRKRMNQADLLGKGVIVREE